MIGSTQHRLRPWVRFTIAAFVVSATLAGGVAEASTADSFTVTADGHPHIGGLGGSVSATSSEKLERSGVLTGGQGSAPYYVASGPGVVRGTLSGEFTNPQGFTLGMAPQILARSDNEFTIHGPGDFFGFKKASLNYHVGGGTLTRSCGQNNCTIRVRIEVDIPGPCCRTIVDIDTSGSVTTNTNELGLTVTPISDGFRVEQGSGTTPIFSVGSDPFIVRLELSVEMGFGGNGAESTSTWQADFGDVAGSGMAGTFAHDRPVFNLEPGSDSITGASILDNRWSDPFVVPVEGQPDAVDDAATVGKGSFLNDIDVLANDIGADPLEITGNSDPASGSVSCSSMSCNYAPDEGFTGVDEFTYTIADGEGGTDTATVLVTVVDRAARLTVAVDTEPDDPQDFHYRLSRTDTNGIGIDSGDTLDDDPADETLSNERTYESIDSTRPVSVRLVTTSSGISPPTGTPEGWVLLEIDCGSHGSFTTARADLTLATGDDARCTLRLVRADALLTIAVDALPDDAQDFHFRLNRSHTNGFGVDSGHSLDDDPTDGALPNERTFETIDSSQPVSLRLVSSPGGGSPPLGVPQGWALQEINCGGHGVFTTLRADLTLAPGDHARCTIRLVEAITPVVTGVPDRAANANGWYNAPVTIDWQAVDPAPSAGAPTDPADTLAATEGANVAYQSEPSCDPVGNCATGTLALSIDTTPPSVSCPSPAPTFTLHQPGAAVTGTVADALSGPTSSTADGSADTRSVGAKTVAITGTDLAGNETTVECAYRVSYVFTGFQAPVVNPPARNSVIAGQIVPLKWRLMDAFGAPVTNLTTARMTASGQACPLGTTPGIGGDEQTAGDGGLQNLGDGNYQLNWRTPRAYARSCKRLALDLGEGSPHVADFEFRA